MDFSATHQASLDRASSVYKFELGLCGVILFASMGGCRSSMPKFNMFGFKREPSAEALAGTGPTTTYPVSPSAGLTPEAIASAAAGTAAPSGMKPQTGSIASTQNFGQTVPVSTGTPMTNPAAAAANGFYGAGTGAGNPSTATSPASYANATGTAGGFSYGQNPNPGKPMIGTAATAASFSPNKPAATTGGVPGYAQTGPAATSTVPAYSAVPGYPLPGATSPVASSPATNPAIVPAAATPSQLATAAPATQLPQLPSANATPSTPSSSTVAAPSFSMPPMASLPPAPSIPNSTGGFAMPPAVAAPEASVASLPPASSEPRAMAPTAPSTGGYKPGSTAGAVSYPAGDYPSTGRDTFYR